MTSSTVISKIEKLERKLNSIDKGLWSLRASFRKAFSIPERLGKGRVWGLTLTERDIQEAKKSLFDFDISEFVTRRDLAAWKRRR